MSTNYEVNRAAQWVMLARDAEYRARRYRALKPDTSAEEAATFNAHAAWAEAVTWVLLWGLT